MRTKIIILALVICLAFLPVFQVQGQTVDTTKPEIVDITQGTPVTGGQFTLSALVTDDSGIDRVQFYVYFELSDGITDITDPEYPEVLIWAQDEYRSTVSVPDNASVIKYNIQTYDNNGNANFSDVLNKDVQDNMNPVAVSQSLINVDLGAPCQFNGSLSRDNIGIANYTWTFIHDGQNIALSGTEPVFNFTKYGTYIITLKVTDAGGNWDTASITVSTMDGISPVANPGILQVEYIGQVVKLDGLNSTDNVGIERYVWSFYHNGTLVTLSGSNTEFIFWEVGEYNVTLTVTDAAGNSDQDYFTVHVLHYNITPSDEMPWWSLALMVMVITVMVTAVFILKSSKN